MKKGVLSFLRKKKNEGDFCIRIEQKKHKRERESK